MSFSASAFKLNLYKTCPKQYSFVYLEGLKDQYETPKPYLTMGAHVHNALKDLYELVDPNARTAEKLETLLRTRWKENRKGFDTVEDERKWGTKAIQMLRLFAHKTDLSQTPVMLEDFYDANITPALRLIGRVDRVDELSDGTLHVKDYKTGKPDPEPDFLALLLYTYIIQQSTGKTVSKASYWYLMNGELATVVPDEENMAEALEEVQRVVGKITKDQDFEPTLNPFCRTCDFQSICPIQDQVQDYLKQREEAYEREA